MKQMTPIMNICWCAFFLALTPLHATARLHQARAEARRTRRVQHAPSAPRALTPSPPTPLDAFAGQWNLTHARNGTDLAELTLPPGASLTMDLRGTNATSHATGALSAYGLLLFVQHGNLLYAAGDVVSRRSAGPREVIRVTSTTHFTTGAPTRVPYRTVEEYAEGALRTLTKITLNRSTGSLTLASPTSRMTFSRTVLWQS
mmetsp:Transcript_22372/g.34717  ORF Transcript_22372/g.34717 Transcript_22372/m.34717 type:complete len:202 (-) Transcript_22372:72-677(-)